MKAEMYVQICLEPPDGTNGPGLFRLLQLVLTSVPAGWATLSDVDLVGGSRASLGTESRAVRVVSVVQLLALLQDTEQIVWANVFLCRSREVADEITGSEDYCTAVEKAEVLVRVVDASYYYVYGLPTRLAEIRNELGGEQKEGLVGELDFPE
jgi:hypothetical protein